MDQPLTSKGYLAHLVVIKRTHEKKSYVMAWDENLLETTRQALSKANKIYLKNNTVLFVQTKQT